MGKFGHSLVTALLLAGTWACRAQEPSASGPASICEIRKNPADYIGKIVTVSGAYATDSRHYEYQKDASCSSENTLDIGFVVPERDASVQAFEADQAAECERTGRRYMCVLEGQATIRGEIAQTKGAHLQPDLVYLVINPHSVLSHSLRAER